MCRARGGPRPQNVFVYGYPVEGNSTFLTDILSRYGVACVAGVIGEGEGERGRREKMRGRGERERLPQEPHSIHFCVRWQTQISDWLIFDSKSLEN